MTCRNVEPSESSSATEIAMDDQLPDDIEIGYSTLRMLRLVGLAVIMTLVSASVAFNWFADKKLDGFVVVVGYAGVAFFGLGTLKIVWKLISAKGPVVFVNRCGIRDLRISNELILWGSVENIAVWEYRRQKCIVLKISPALEGQLFASKARQAMLLANRAVGVDGVAISASGLTMDFDTLLKACMAYYSAVESSRLVPRQPDRIWDGGREMIAVGSAQTFASDDAAAGRSR
jgi:hypothetical protein